MLPFIIAAKLGSCDFEKDFCGMIQDQSDNFDWDRWTMETNTWYTGPRGAQSGLYYIYIETSNFPGRNAPRKTGDFAVYVLQLHALTLMLLMANLANAKFCKKLTEEMAETLAHGYLSESNQRVLFNEYQFDRI